MLVKASLYMTIVGDAVVGELKVPPRLLIGRVEDWVLDYDVCLAMTLAL
ncbi:MAG: hypothetical protein LC808_12385 [Actinobacteria bacterium]|nr:hypothetical protein [Actinomycetota bacterium]